MKYIEKNKKGMTLVETITGIGMLSIIILLIITLIIITIKKEMYYEKQIGTYIYLNAAINFIENQLDVSIKEVSVKNKVLMLKKEKGTIINIWMENSVLKSNKTVKIPSFKLDNVEFKESGSLLYVTIEMQGEKLTRCLELKSQGVKRGIFQ